MTDELKALLMLNNIQFVIVKKKVDSRVTGVAGFLYNFVIIKVN